MARQPFLSLLEQRSGYTFEAHAGVTRWNNFKPLSSRGDDTVRQFEAAFERSGFGYQALNLRRMLTTGALCQGLDQGPTALRGSRSEGVQEHHIQPPVPKVLSGTFAEIRRRAAGIIHVVDQLVHHSKRLGIITYCIHVAGQRF
jgi:hypothetical protein